MPSIPGSKRGSPRVGALALAVLALSLACLGQSRDLLHSDSGGEGTTSSANRNAFGNAARNLTGEERRRFEVGDSFFTQNWVTAPASTAAAMAWARCSTPRHVPHAISATAGGAPKPASSGSCSGSESSRMG